jgi:cobyrinic acid a,c-diamide synthase
MVIPPRLVIAATRSGDGKTTVATGLMAALRRRGMAVSGHKVGPDFIDPSYHAAATGRPGRNLDPWLVGEERIGPLFAHGAAGAKIAVVEGVMGLFDGTDRAGLPPDFGSTAHIARLLEAPVVLVVGAAGTSRSIAATVHGFATFDPRIRLSGVILNQVASPRHEQLLRDAVASTGIPVVGALSRRPELQTPSRHLGLVPAAERADEMAGWLPALEAAISQDLDLDGLVRVAQTAPALSFSAWKPAETRVSGGPPVRVAVATGPAFTFGYTEHLELLRAAGAEVEFFDPCSTTHLPAGADAVVVGGGFPEVHVDALADNASLRAEVRSRAADGMPIVAECAGQLWLAESLDDRPQCGLLPTEARMTDRLTLGYRESRTLHDNPLLAAGTTVRAHEFHRTHCSPVAGRQPAWQDHVDGGVQAFEPHPGQVGRQHGWASERLLSSYLHLHWAGLPGAASRLVRTAAESRVP